MSHRAPSIFATVTVNLTREEHEQLVAAAARVGKSQRRLMKDAMRAFCGRAPSIPHPGRRTDLIEKRRAASDQLATREAVSPPQEGSYGQPTS